MSHNNHFKICVNPFHYERVEEVHIPPVLVPRYPPAHFAHLNFEGIIITHCLLYDS